jgi:hypothetical protein
VLLLFHCDSFSGERGRGGLAPVAVQDSVTEEAAQATAQEPVQAEWGAALQAGPSLLNRIIQSGLPSTGDSKRAAS